MAPMYLDPSPRSYPAFVHLLARSSRGKAAAGNAVSFKDLEDWLLGEAINEDSMLVLVESLAWRMLAAGLPVTRATIHVGTLHPQLTGFSWFWEKSDGLCDEIVIKAMSLQTEAYLRSPLRAPIEEGISLFLDTREQENRDRYPIVQDLAEQGIVHYAVLPMPKRIGARRYDVVTIATDVEEGFTREQQILLGRILKYLALHVHRHVARRIAENVMSVYLGASAGRQVLDGSIMRGNGNPIQAVIWCADMRGFTELSERYTGPQVNQILNLFFEKLVDAVQAHGGDVLKFVGDGVLAVFPYDDENGAGAASRAAMEAADQAMHNMDKLNSNPPDCLKELEGWSPLRFGIAMHNGEVFFGNVGGADRLDFTVIGSAVNEAARLETLTKKVMRPIVMSQDVAKELSIQLDDLGKHELKGIADTVRVFAPKHWKSNAIVT
ncbi:MAG: adenylate/guanylate cyclase domain-containing protein [Anderseniella sp.]